jgi:lysophospholipase L1-like esterase
MQRFATVIPLVLGGFALASCGGGSDPFAADPDGGGPAEIDAGGPPDGGEVGPADAAVPRSCAPKPKRMVVLGDSITACNVIGGKLSQDCVSKKVNDYVKATYAPDLTYENLAQGGAQLGGIPAQLDAIPAGAGHVLVVVYIGGNDLAPFIFQSDMAAMNAYQGIKDKLTSTWAMVYEKLGDEAKFPDGFTLMVNNQYNPFDDCTAPPYNLSAVKTDILHKFNGVVADIVKDKQANTILIDQYTPYLGHGHHFDVATCPHYKAGSVGYMKDTIHANAAGNEALAKELGKAADLLYRDCK